MSSRNVYLRPEERKAAPVLNRSLTEAKNRFDQGERNARKLIAAGKRVMAQGSQCPS